MRDAFAALMKQPNVSKPVKVKKIVSSKKLEVDNSISSTSDAHRPGRVECPICHKQVAHDFMNAHIDFTCSALRKDSPSTDMKRKTSFESHVKVTPPRKTRRSLPATPISPDQKENIKPCSPISPQSSVSNALPQTPPTASKQPSAISCEPTTPTPKGDPSTPQTPLMKLSELPIPKLTSSSTDQLVSAGNASKPRTSLHDFFNLPSYLPPKYFYLDWPEKIDKDHQPSAKFVSRKPEVTVFSQVISWKDRFFSTDLTICTNMPQCSLEIEDEWRSKSSIYTNIPYLKSHLQKCIRRQRADLAVKTAWEMATVGDLHHSEIWDGLGQLLRRLPIICLEDVSLHQQFPVLVFLMIAHAKKYALPVEALAWVLGFIHTLATSHQRDAPNFEAPRQELRLDTSKVFDAEYQFPQALDILYSLSLRKAYGGVGGDKNMMANAMISWFDRFSNVQQRDKMESLLITTPIEPIHPFELARLQHKDWELVAIDFHVSNILVAAIERYNLAARGWTEQTLRDIMWQCGGGFNTRDNTSLPQQSQWKALWMQIQPLAARLLENKG